MFLARTCESSQSHYQSANIRVAFHATQLFHVRAISDAFHAAKATDVIYGTPTEEARRAYRWLMKDPISRYITPPRTFAWCCIMGCGADWLRVRRVGLLPGQYGWKETINGISGIRQAWNAARFEWLISGGPFLLAHHEALLDHARWIKREARPRCEQCHHLVHHGKGRFCSVRCQSKYKRERQSRASIDAHECD